MTHVRAANHGYNQWVLIIRESYEDFFKKSCENNKKMRQVGHVNRQRISGGIYSFVLPRIFFIIRVTEGVCLKYEVFKNLWPSLLF